MEFLLEYLKGNIPQIITIILGFGVFSVVFKKFIVVAKEATEFLKAITDAYQDKKITKDELQKITKEAKDLSKASKQFALALIKVFKKK